MKDIQSVLIIFVPFSLSKHLKTYDTSGIFFLSNYG